MLASNPSNPTSVSEKFPTLYHLFIEAVKLFSSRQLASTSRLGTAGKPIAKEATFHFELYRVLHGLLGGQLFPTPEFGKWTNHSLDLMVPGVGWGIECLHEGRKLGEHAERFAQGGAYHKWLGIDIQDFILVDFRVSTPRFVHHGTYLRDQVW